jgi:RNA polymerase sigma factor (sigma-70 family)
VNGGTDQELLRDYDVCQSEAAFAELVRRHVDFVYSVALRMVRDPHLAEDVTQGVFTALARSASELAKRPVLAGWLHRTATNLAANAVRADVRRRAREQQAATMKDLNEPEVQWDQLAPHLDDALGELSEPDRDALLLRYFEGKSAREMAQVLGTSEEAAQKRVNRAVDRLRDILNRRGISVGTKGLAVVIVANAVQAAPSGLSAAMSTATSLAGTVVGTSNAVATTHAIAMTTLQKTIVGATLAIAVGTGVYEARQASNLRGELHALQRKHHPLAGRISELTGELDDALRRIDGLRDDNERLRSNSAELARLRGERIITQRVPVDEVYDTRFVLGLHGVGSADWLSTTDRDTMTEVRRAFAAANLGAVAADLHQLLPYATTPEQQAALHKRIERSSGSREE